MDSHPPDSHDRDRGPHRDRAGPIGPKRRILTLDVLRGFALLGILVVHAPVFLQPVHLQVLGTPDGGTVDQAVGVLVDTLFEGKFFSLFSLLFGIGLAIQLRRSETSDRPFVPFLVRRMAILGAFGILHVVLIWWGDILTYYALLGLLLIPLRNRPPRRLLELAGAALLVPIVSTAVLIGVSRGVLLLPDGPAALQESYDATLAGAERGAAAAYRIYGGSDPLAMVAQRFQDWSLATAGTFLQGILFVVLAMFLLGLWVGVRGIHEDLFAHVDLLRRIRRWGVLVGAAGTLAWLLARPETRLQPGGLGLLLSTAGFVIGTPALALGYASTLTLALRESAWQTRLAPLAALGRTALSNYLLQSLVMSTLAYGYGFGLYGRLDATESRLIALAIVGVQLPLAVAWTRRFRYGPVEWLWRSLAYGRIQPWRAKEE